MSFFRTPTVTMSLMILQSHTVSDTVCIWGQPIRRLSRKQRPMVWQADWFNSIHASCLTTVLCVWGGLFLYVCEYVCMPVVSVCASVCCVCVSCMEPGYYFYKWSNKPLFRLWPLWSTLTVHVWVLFITVWLLTMLLRSTRAHTKLFC